MNDLATRFASARAAKLEEIENCPHRRIPHSGPTCGIILLRLIPRLCCAVPLGAVLDLRLPPPVSSVRFTRNLKQDWQSKPPAARELVCAPRRLLPARK